MWQEMHSSAAGWGLASAASPRIVRHRGGAPGDIVRIVAGGAGELPGAGQEAGRFPQTVGRTGELEFIVVAGAGRVVEMEGVVFQRLSRAEGKDTPVEARDGRGESQGGGLQVALQADFHPADGVEPGRIHDGAAHFVPRSDPLHGLEVRLAGTVTALAIDALRHGLGEYGGVVAGTSPVVQWPFEGTVVWLAQQVRLAAAYRQGRYLLGRLVAEGPARD